MTKVSLLKNKIFNFFWKPETNSTHQLKEYVWFSSKASKWKFFIVSYVLITLVFCPYFYNMVSDFIETNNNAFFYFYLVFSILNVFIFSKFVKLKEYQIDLFTNLLIFLLKHFFNFLNLIWIRFSKIFLFIFPYKLNKIIYFFKKVNSSFYLLWRPLFKRLSYFGNYKNSRSKFFN